MKLFFSSLKSAPIPWVCEINLNFLQAGLVLAALFEIFFCLVQNFWEGH